MSFPRFNAVLFNPGFTFEYLLGRKFCAPPEGGFGTPLKFNVFLTYEKEIGHPNATVVYKLSQSIVDKWTHKALFVWDVVCQLQFVKWDNFLHPLFPRGRGIGMNVHSLWHFRISFAGNYPPTENKKNSKIKNQKSTETLKHSKSHFLHWSYYSLKLY